MSATYPSAVTVVPCLAVTFEEELVLALWTSEAARSTVLGMRGHTGASVRVAGRARILATRCSELGVALRTDFAGEHARWMGQVAGYPEDTGALGWFFLQRLGAYVDLHSEAVLPKGYWSRLVELGAQDGKDVGEALMRDGLPPPPPAEWPGVPAATAPGEVHTRIGVIGDPHVGSTMGDKFLPPVIDEMNKQGVDFSVAIGDLTQSGREEHFRQIKGELDRLASPYEVTLGNHDMWGGGTPSAVGQQRFESIFARRPFGVRDTGKARVILLNSADPRESPFPPFDLITGTFTSEPNEAVPGGSFSEETVAFAESLGRDGPTLIVLHHPPYPYLGFPALMFGLDERSTGVLRDLARRTKAWGIIAGHTHRSALSELDGIPVLEVPSPKEWPYGYGIVEVSDEGWAFNLHPAGDEALVAESSGSANVVIRRYSRGPDEARAFSAPAPGPSRG
ncbi:MAG: 3,5-cyclic-AMP phosphodiesterase [Actinomycetota bacterium]|nr:3,5-cyclic-AMP phosphodiesterase [Actinomycetota bacterium]